MANCDGVVFHTQIASIMEVLANAAVTEICKLVDDDYAVFRLEISQSQKENRALRRKLQLLEPKVSRERVLASGPNSVKILDGYRGMARGEEHFTGGHRSFVKPAGLNPWRDDQPIAINEETGTSTQHVIVIEPADAEAVGPGASSLVKQEKTEGEEDPQHSRDIQTGAAAGVAPPVAVVDLATTPQPRTRPSITEVILKSETDTETHRLLHTGSDHGSDPERLLLGRLGCSPAPDSKYLLYENSCPRTVHSHQDSRDALETVNDLSRSYTTEMDPGIMPLVLETQTDLSRGDWNPYSSRVYSEGCLDKKGEVIVIDEVKVEGDAPLTCNADETPIWKGYSQGNTSDFLDCRDGLETSLNVAIHSPSHELRDRDPVSTSMAPSDSHGRVFFDQVFNSNDRARAQTQGGGATSGNSKEKRFLCMFCNKGFSCLQKVEIHQRVHTGENPFNCTQCEKRFSRQDHLKRHQMVHTGEKPFSCPQCEKRFSRQDQLKMHLKVHTGERPFVCTHCGKRFSERSYLRIHQQKMHAALVCNQD